MVMNFSLTKRIVNTVNAVIIFFHLININNFFLNTK